MTDAAGDASQYYYDDNGDLVKTVDPLGNVTVRHLRQQRQPDQPHRPDRPDRDLHLRRQRQPDQRDQPAGPDHQLTPTPGPTTCSTSVTNPQGDTTSYHYNASGDLTSIRVPRRLGRRRPTYDALGDPLSLTDPDGQVNSYTYNAAGQVTSVDPGRRHHDDLHLRRPGQPDHGDRLRPAPPRSPTTGGPAHRRHLPDGLSLHYTYNAGGQRTQMVEMSGSTVTETVNYAYNTLGQLTELTDGSGNLIVSYTYNNLGELTREDKGDGTYTTYTYDADGNLLDLVELRGRRHGRQQLRLHLQRARARRPAMATIDGTWTYSYDNAGELVHAAFASTNPSVPSQDLTYVYNAAGDRTQTIVNGVTTTYTSNSVNEYTTVGGTTYELQRQRQPDLDDRCLRHDDLHLQFAQPPGQRHLADR